MIVRSRRTAALAIGAALLALATACTNPTAPAASRTVGGMSGDGVTVGGGTNAATTSSGVTVGGGT